MQTSSSSSSSQRILSSTTRDGTAPRRVQFAPIVTAIPANPLCSEAWYSHEELSHFKEQARHIMYSSFGMSTSSSSSERGFEYATPQRRKHRRMTIQCTLNAARKGLSAFDLSQVAQKCSEWSQDAAFLQGCHDYACVYQPEMSQWIPEVLPPTFPFPVVSHKRLASSTTTSSNQTINKSEERRVRRRLSAAPYLHS